MVAQNLLLLLLPLLPPLDGDAAALPRYFPAHRQQQLLLLRRSPV
jgi:hypothetical protein